MAASKPARGQRAVKNKANKVVMPGGNGKAKAPAKKKEKTDPSKPKKRMVAMTGGNGKKKKNA